MAMHAPDKLTSALDQISKTAQNLAAIGQARRKHEQERSLFDLHKKQAQLNLETAQAKNEGTALEHKMLEAQMNEYFKQQKTILDGKTAMIDTEEHKQKQTGMMADQVARQTINEDPQLRYGLAQRLNPSLAQVPGPQGGVVQGMQESQDTPEALPASAFDNVPEHILEPSMTGGKAHFKEGKPAAFILKRIKAFKAKGATLTPMEEEALFKDTHPTYNRDKVLTHARAMANDAAKADYRKSATPNEIVAMMPKAEEMLYGESVPRSKNSAVSKTSISPEASSDAGGESKSNQAPEGTLVKDATGKTLRKVSGKWVPQQ